MKKRKTHIGYAIWVGLKASFFLMGWLLFFAHKSVTMPEHLADLMGVALCSWHWSRTISDFLLRDDADFSFDAWF